MSPHLHLNDPPTIPSPIICNNNTMDMVFLLQMKQSYKCGSIRNDKIIKLHLGSGAGPWVSISYLLQATNHIIDSILLKQLTWKNWRIQKWDPNSKKLYHTALGYIHTTNG